MAQWLIVLCPCLALALPGVSSACDESRYQNHLSQLQELVPAVSGGSPSPSFLSNFFDALPPDFGCFSRVFGYNGGPAPLYSEPQLYALFPKLAAAVPAQQYVPKLVGLSVNAKWDADQINALQDASREALRANTSIYARQLEQLDADAERTVWTFLFGGPHPSKELLSADVQAQLCAVSDRSCASSKAVLERELEREHTH